MADLIAAFGADDVAVALGLGEEAVENNDK